MLREEFEHRTGVFPPMALYEVIERYYTDFNGDKDSFCQAYRKNIAGMAEKIQYEADMRDLDTQRRLEKRIQDLMGRIAGLEEELEREQEWRPHEIASNVSQAEYGKLAQGAEDGKSCYYMTDEEAVAWICSEFDFNPQKVTIIHEIYEYEVNRHGLLRRTGRRIDRRPVYCASDYHYIRFDTSRWRYEVWNDTLRPFYD